MVRDRKAYTSLKERGISVLFVHKLLSSSGVKVPQRTLQYHIDNDFLKCKSNSLEKVVKLIINNYDNLKEEISEIWAD